MVAAIYRKYIMIEWTKGNSINLLKATGILFLLAYLWSILFKILAGLKTSHIMLTEPWYAFYFIGFEDPNITKKLYISGGITAFLLIALIANGIRQRYLSKLHGDAHWANETEIRKSGLRDQSGVVLGKKGSNYLITNGDEHIAVYAPPRSGKGVGVVIPTLFNWDGSVITLDVKRENYDMTSGFRAKYSEVYIWEPLSSEGNTCSINPLSFIDKNNKVTRFNEIDKVTSILLPPYLDKGEIWQPAARDLLNAMFLLLIDLDSQRFTLGEVLRLILKADDFEAYIEAIIEQYESKLDPICIRNLNGFLQKAHKEQSGVLSTIKSALSLWNNPIVDAATSKSDFDIRDLRKKRISVYVSVKPDDLDRLSILLTLFFQQVISTMTQDLPGDDEPHHLLMLLDEFTTLSKMPVMEKGMGFLPGYHVRVMPIIQGISQLETVYGKDGARTFLQTCKYKVIFAQNDGLTAAQVSKDLGTRTVKSFGFSHNTSAGKGGSVNQNYMGKPLLNQDEVMRLNKKKEIVMVEANAPIMANKVVYYKDKTFADRQLQALPLPKIDLDVFLSDLLKPALNLDLKVAKKTPANEEGYIDSLVDELFE